MDFEFLEDTTTSTKLRNAQEMETYFEKDESFMRNFKEKIKEINNIKERKKIILASLDFIKSFKSKNSETQEELIKKEKIRFRQNLKEEISTLPEEIKTAKVSELLETKFFFKFLANLLISKEYKIGVELKKIRKLKSKKKKEVSSSLIRRSNSADIDTISVSSFKSVQKMPKRVKKFTRSKKKIRTYAKSARKIKLGGRSNSKTKIWR